MTRNKLLRILQEKTDEFTEQNKLRDAVLDAMKEAYQNGKKERYWGKKEKQLN